MTHPSFPSPMSLTEAIYSRRSVRKYEPTRVDDVTIGAVLEMAVQAPSAMNRQPWGFTVVQDLARLRRYSDQAKLLLLATMPADAKAERYAAMLADPAFNIFYDASTLIVVSVDAPDPYSDPDCWLAVQNLLLAAHTRGLGTCCVGLAVAVLNTPEIKRELGVAPDGRVVAPIILGVPGVQPPPVPRRPPRLLAWLR